MRVKILRRPFHTLSIAYRYPIYRLSHVSIEFGKFGKFPLFFSLAARKKGSIIGYGARSDPFGSPRPSFVWGSGLTRGELMARRILVNPNRNDSENRVYSQSVTTEMLYKVDFSNAASDLSTSVSSVAAESKGSQGLTLTTPSVSSNVASFYASSDSSGVGAIKVTATFASGKKDAQFIKLRITNPAEVRFY